MIAGTDCDSTWKFVKGWQKAFSNCTNATGVLDMSKADRDAQAWGRLDLLKRSVAMLHAHNKTAILNTARLYNPAGSGGKGCTGASTGLDCSCTVQYEDYVKAFAPYPWIRF